MVAQRPHGLEADALQKRRRPSLRLLLIAVVVTGVGLASCSSTRYVGQAVWGGARVLAKRQPLERYAARVDLSEGRRRSIEVAQQARDFAVRELGLPDNRSYRTVVDLGRPEATWTVTAAPEFSLVPVVWCFPIAGCVSYRGYFSKKSAERFASGLEQDGFDVVVRGVSAYSTLGWFADPLFAAHLDLEPWRLAGLIFHELAHQVVYVPGDTMLNESFASAVERIGVDLWLAGEGAALGATSAEAIAAVRDLEQRFVRLVVAQRPCFEAAYEGSRDGPDALESVRRAKRAEFEQLAELARSNGLEAYRAWFEQSANNARLAAISDYERWVPVFLGVAGEPADTEPIFELARRLAEMEPEERLTELERRSAALGEEELPEARCVGGTRGGG